MRRVLRMQNTRAGKVKFHGHAQDTVFVHMRTGQGPSGWQGRKMLRGLEMRKSIIALMFYMLSNGRLPEKNDDIISWSYIWLFLGQFISYHIWKIYWCLIRSFIREILHKFFKVIFKINSGSLLRMNTRGMKTGSKMMDRTFAQVAAGGIQQDPPLGVRRVVKRKSSVASRSPR